ncbi:MAG: sulfatase-like hydrolase/transferase [Bacteroidales bacterium]|nr:sulfatase-like hydrolase/transferase [Bacteroidales bacterium]
MKKYYKLVAISLAPLCGAMAQNGKVTERPNILLISADDLGWSDIGCYDSEVKTPNIDALANSGVRFTQFHNTSKSYPSRACLLTGLYAQQNGYFKYFGGPLGNSVTLGEYMKSAGYRTLWSGKHHGDENPRTRGFDHYIGLKDGACNYFNPGLQRYGEEKPAQKSHRRKWCIEDKEYAPYTPTDKNFYTTEHFTENALMWLDQYENDDKPFFLYLAYNAAYDPLMAWSEDIVKYEGVSLLSPILGDKTKREKPLFWEWQHGRAVRDGKWKLVKQGQSSAWPLFDMQNDPSETIDLASKNPKIVEHMNEMFNTWKKRVSITKGVKAIK